MGRDTEYVVKKKSTWLSVLKTLLVLAAVAFAAYKIYEKFFKKAKLAKSEEPELLEREVAVEEEPPVEEVTFEAAAEDVIADSEPTEA